MLRFLLPLFAAALLSEEELRFSYADKQQFDTSCGIAVTASLLSNYWNIPAKEQDIYTSMIPEQALKTGETYIISFKTITDYLATHNIAGRAYKMSWNELSESLNNGFAPIIVNYAKPQPHFALLLGIIDGYALMADPSAGFNLIDRSTFLKHYSGNALLTASADVAKNTALIEKAVADANLRLTRLNQLAASRRHGR